VRPRFVYSVEFLPIGVWLVKSYVLVFLILQRWFVSGLTMGAVR
jgi:ABC-type maltose transport system permease subunit